MKKCEKCDELIAMVLKASEICRMQGITLQMATVSLDSANLLIDRLKNEVSPETVRRIQREVDDQIKTEKSFQQLVSSLSTGGGPVGGGHSSDGPKEEAVATASGEEPAIQATIDAIVAEYGQESLEDVLMNEDLDGVVLGGCVFCQSTRNVEPDGENYTCYECGKKGVSSLLILAGLI